MKGHWWSCVLGLLCMPAEVILNNWTVFQSPSSISYVKMNSSAVITCATSCPDVMGFYLHGQFHGKRNIVYLSINKGQVAKHTTAAEFEGRLQVIPNNVEQGLEFTMTLSLLGLEDTDLYYCEWSQLNQQRMRESWSSKGTILIVREYDPHEQCKQQTLKHIFISLSVAAFIVILFLFIGAVVLKCRRFRKHFRPSRIATPPRPIRPQHFCSQQSVQHYPYWITSENNLDLR